MYIYIYIYISLSIYLSLSLYIYIYMWEWPHRSPLDKNRNDIFPRWGIRFMLPGINLIIVGHSYQVELNQSHMDIRFLPTSNTTTHAVDY